MKQKTSKTDYFVKIALMIIGGLVLVFFMSKHIWDTIHREENLAYSIDHIAEFRLDYGDKKLGEYRFQSIDYQVLFSDGHRWGGVVSSTGKNWNDLKVKLHSILQLDTTNLKSKIPLRLKSENFKILSEKGIIAMRSEKKGWKLLKIGDEYLVNSPFTIFQLIMLYFLLMIFIAIGIFVSFGGVYLLIKDTKGFKTTEDLTYIPGKWDGLMYVLRGFKHEEKEKNEGESFKKKNQN